MLLADIANLITENVEKLIPHLKEQIGQYIEQRKQAGLPLPAEYNIYQRARWDDKAVDWVLRSDPRFLKDLRKKKPLAHSKSPFAKYIIKWWLSPNNTIELPEDIGTTAEALQIYNNAQQQGLNTDISQFETFDQLIDAIQPFVKGEQPDSYEDMGLSLEWGSGPWRMYKVDKFIPGEVSSLYPDQVCHRAFEGTNWCVKYQNTFERGYSGTYYLILHGRKRFALINFPSMQFKNPKDRPIGSSEFDAAAEFLSLLFADKPEFIAELALAQLNRNYGGHWGDFLPFHSLFAEQAAEILDSPMARETALKTPKNVQNLAILINEWPNFDGWPEGKVAIQQADFHTHDASIIEKYIIDHGRDEVIEQRLPVDSIKKYIKWVGTKHKEQALELLPMARATIEKQIQNDPAHMRSALALIVVEAALHKPQRWPQLEKAIKVIGDSRAALAYVRHMDMPRFPDFEPLIAQDPRASQFYMRLTGIDLSGRLDVLSEPTTPEQIVQRAAARGEEVPDKEPIILQDLNAAIRYAQHVIGPWPELEAKLRQHGTPEQKHAYAKNVLYNELV